jgi:hypothetical protein
MLDPAFGGRNLGVGQIGAEIVAPMRVSGRAWCLLRGGDEKHCSLTT